MTHPSAVKEIIHTQALLCQSALTEAALCLSVDNRDAAVEHLQQASHAIGRVLSVLDQLRERPPMEGVT